MNIQVYQGRRQRLFDQLPDNSLLLLPSAQLVTRSRDSEYPFRQHSDFWYLTGFNEPDALLLLHKQQGKNRSLLFNQRKIPEQETWTGLRLGQAAAPATLGVDEALPIDAADEYLPQLLAQADSVWLPLEEASFYQQYLRWCQRSKALQKRTARLPQQLVDVTATLAEMRLIKDAHEISLLRRATEISAQAHCRAMRSCRAGGFEYQLQAEIEHEFLMQGARAPAYNTIVGGGANGCILHYVDNSAELRQGDLVLIDAGAEYQGYAGDITRTFPVSGQFTEPQKALYELVLAANEQAIAQVRPGITLEDLHQGVIRLLTEGLIRLGLLQDDLETCLKTESYRTFYMHGTSHWLGLDVHDAGAYRINGQARSLQPGMVFTIEPGLYVAPDCNRVDPQWRGIGIRIEDNVLVTQTGCEVLTLGVPKQVADIEALMRQAHAT